MASAKKIKIYHSETAAQIQTWRISGWKLKSSLLTVPVLPWCQDAPGLRCFVFGLATASLAICNVLEWAFFSLRSIRKNLQLPVFVLAAVCSILDKHHRLISQQNFCPVLRIVFRNILERIPSLNDMRAYALVSRACSLQLSCLACTCDCLAFSSLEIVVAQGPIGQNGNCLELNYGHKNYWRDVPSLYFTPSLGVPVVYCCRLIDHNWLLACFIDCCCR